MAITGLLFKMLFPIWFPVCSWKSMCVCVCVCVCACVCVLLNVPDIEVAGRLMLFLRMTWLSMLGLDKSLFKMFEHKIACSTTVAIRKKIILYILSLLIDTKILIVYEIA